MFCILLGGVLTASSTALSLDFPTGLLSLTSFSSYLHSGRSSSLTDFLFLPRLSTRSPSGPTPWMAFDNNARTL